MLDDDDLATWLLYYLEQHGARVRLTDDNAVKVDLDTLQPALDAVTAARWAPVIVRAIPAMRVILRARREPVH